MLTRSDSTGIFRSLLSNWTATYAVGAPPAWDLCTRSERLWPLSSLGLSSPKENFRASRILDLPEPLGPVITVKPVPRLIETFLLKVLKPRMSIFLMNTKAGGSEIVWLEGLAGAGE